jgi:hypothetical protein
MAILPFRRALTRRQLARGFDHLRSRLTSHPPAPETDHGVSRRFRNIVRRLRPAEHRIIAVMLARADRLTPLRHRLDNAWVYEMDDGGMGSLRFIRPDGAPGLGDYIGPAAFTDSDGVEAFVWVNLDKRGDLFELDVWKTDGSPLVAYPPSFP